VTSCSAITFGTSPALFSSQRRAYTFTIGGFLQVSYCGTLPSKDLDALIFSSVAFFGLSFIENISSHVHHPIELEMRRPNKERYRLDRLLERKAKEGVKIYVII
jgi:hypothetical protein